MSFIPLLTDATGNAMTRLSQADIYDTPIVGERTNTVIAQFLNDGGNTIDDVLNVTTTGGAGAVMVNGIGTFSSGTGTTSSITAQTYTSIVYNPGFEIYSSFSLGWTIPTSAASKQLVGIWDVANNGFYVGYDGLIFGVGQTVGGVSTFIPRLTWNSDLLDGSSASLFTRNGVPEAINVTYQNVFRIRYGWYGSSPILFEVFSPDGNWILFHSIRHPNTSPNASIQNPNLPMSMLITKTAADATNLVIRSGSWTAGTSSPRTVDVTNFKESTWTSSTPVNTALKVSAIMAASASFALVNSGTISAGVATFEKSIDGVAWFPLNIADITSNVALASTRNLAAGSFSSEAFIGGSFEVRARLTTAIIGSGNVNVMIRPSAEGVSRYVQVYQPDGAKLRAVIDSGSITITGSTTGSPPAAATVGAASAQIVAANAARKGLVLTNTSNNTVSFGLSGNAAVLNFGITLSSRGVWVMDQFTFTTGAIAAIASVAASGVAIQELT